MAKKKIDRKGKPFQPIKFYKGFGVLIPQIAKDFGIPEKISSKIVCDKMGIPVCKPKEIDEQMKCNFNRIYKEGEAWFENNKDIYPQIAEA